MKINIVSIQCDKRKPVCGNCKSTGFSNYCKYKTEDEIDLEENYRRINSILKEQIRKLESKIKQIEVQTEKKQTEKLEIKINNGNDDNINKNDPILDLATKFQMLDIGQDHTTHFGGTSRTILSSLDPIFKHILNFAFKSTNLIETEVKSNIIDFNDRGIENLLLGYDTISNNSNPILNNYIKKRLLIAEVEKILPDKYICDIILKNAVHVIRTLFPSYQGKHFFEKFNTILDLKAMKFSQQYKFNIDLVDNIDNSDDFVLLATFLLFLRFGYISLPYMNGDPIYLLSLPKYKHLKPIFDNHIEIPEEFAFLSQRAVSVVFLSKNSFQMMGYLIILRFYYSVAPEYGEKICMENNAIILGRICQIALSLRLNRDPDNIYHEITDMNKYQLRQMWTIVLMADASQSCDTGRPLILNTNDSDTSPLKLFKSVENDPIFQAEVEYYQLMYKTCQYIRESLQISLNLKTKARRSNLESITEKMLTFLLETKPSFADLLLRKPDEILLNRNKRLRLINLRIELLAYIHISYYILYLNFGPEEKELNNKYFKYASLTAMALFHFSLKHLNDCNNYYDYGILSIILPILLKSVLKASMFIVSILLRSQIPEYLYSVPDFDFIYKSNPDGILSTTETEYEVLRSGEFREASKRSLMSVIFELEKVTKRYSIVYIYAQKISFLASLMAKTFQNKSLLNNNNGFNSTSEFVSFCSADRGINSEGGELDLSLSNDIINDVLNPNLKQENEIETEIETETETEIEVENENENENENDKSQSSTNICNMINEFNSVSNIDDYLTDPIARHFQFPYLYDSNSFNQLQNYNGNSLDNTDEIYENININNDADINMNDIGNFETSDADAIPFSTEWFDGEV